MSDRPSAREPVLAGFRADGEFGGEGGALPFEQGLHAGGVAFERICCDGHVANSLWCGLK